MSDPKASPAEKLVHDVNSKTSSLRTAAAMVKDASDAEAAELLTLMRAQTEKIAAAIDAYRRSRGL